MPEDKPNNRKPSTNIVLVASAEGLASTMNRCLEKLVPETPEQKIRKNDAIEAMKELQSDELFKLRKAFEA